MKTVVKWKNHIWEILFSAGMALVTALQSPLHPFASALPATDSAVYLYAAQRMAEGERLYVDFFEHKGPLLYLMNYLPLQLGGGNTVMVWILELLLLFADGILICRIAGLFTDHSLLKALTAAAVLYPLGFYFEGGNFTEEYALPFLLGGLFIYLEYMLGDQKVLPVKKIFLTGFFCGMVILLRINMIGLFGVYCMVLVCYFIRHGKWQEIGKSMLSFVLGLMASLAPAAVLMACTGVFGSFLEAYFVYNMDYSVGSNGFMDILRAMYVFWGREPFLPVTVVVYAGALFLARKEKKEKETVMLTAGLGTLAVSLYAVSMSGRTYGHYAMILLPCFAVPAVLLLCEVYGRIRNAFAVTALCVLALVAGAPKHAAGFLVNIMGTMQMDASQAETIEYIQAHTEEDENVLVLGNYCEYYLGAKRTSDTRFFYQNPTLDVREDYREEFLEELAENPPVLMVAPAGELGFEDVYIEELVEQGLYEKEEKDTFTAYIKK